MLDLHPRRDPAAVGLANGVVSAGGIGLGMLVSSTVVELLPAPRVLPYVVLLALFAVAFAGALAMPEPVRSHGRVRLTPQRPSVPRSVRRPFLLAALAVISSWSIGGLFFSLGPQFSASLFHSSDHLVAGVGVFVLAGAATVAQLGFGRSVPWAAATGGSIALSIGMLMIVAAVVADSAALYLAGALVGGAGFGVAFLGALRALSAVDPAGAPGGGHVGVLCRRLPRAVAARRARGRPRHAAGTPHDVRGVRRRRRRTRPLGGVRGVANATTG